MYNLIDISPLDQNKKDIMNMKNLYRTHQIMSQNSMSNAQIPGSSFIHPEPLANQKELSAPMNHISRFSSSMQQTLDSTNKTYASM